MGLRRMLVKMLDPAGNGDGTKFVGIDGGKAAWVDPPGGITGLTSDDDSVAITDNGDGTLDLAATGGGVQSVVAGTNVTVDDTDPANPVVSATGGGSGGGSKDPRWNVDAGETSIDEFNDGSIDAAWVRVDGAGAAAGNLVWTEGGDVITAFQNAGGDSADVVHGLMRPLAPFGGAVAPGDAFKAAFKLWSDGNNYAIGGIMLADGTAIGAGKQIAAEYGNSATTGTLNFESAVYTGYNNRSATSTTIAAARSATNLVGPYWLRLVCITLSTWRCDWSPDGYTWIKGTPITQAFTPTHIGLYDTSWGTSSRHFTSWELIRRAAGVS